MALGLPTIVRDPRVQQCLDFLTRQFPITAGALADSAKELFPQLAEGGSRKVNFGSVQVEFAGGTNISKEATVTHGLGTTPSAVLLQSAAFDGEAYNAEVATVGATTFKTRFLFQAFIPGAGTKRTIYWLAIG